MAGLPDFEQRAVKIVAKICLKKAGCVYATKHSGCNTKYSNEVVKDFETGGCLAAAIPVLPSEMGAQNRDPVIPVEVKPDGTVIHQKTQVTLYEHRTELDRGDSGKIEFQT